MIARAWEYRCLACQGRVRFPGIDLSFLVGGYTGLTVDGDFVYADAYSDGGVFDEVITILEALSESDSLPPDVVQRGVHWWVLGETFDPTPNGARFATGTSTWCPLCGERALRMDRELDDVLLGDVVSPTRRRWAGLGRAERTRLVGDAATRVLTNPWFQD